MSVRAAFRIEVQFADGSSPTVWTSLGRDVLQNVHAFRGNDQNGPIDHVARIGTLDFMLRNDSGNSGGVQGWYSPNHASVRSGWTFGIPCRLIGTYNGTDHTLWTGKVKSIRPDAGVHKTRIVSVTAEDIMGDLSAHDAVQISAQVSKTEVQLLQAILAAMPATAQPPATSYDSAIDLYPYAFYNLGAGIKGLSAVTDVIVSSYGWLYPKGDGTLRYENRHTRALRTSTFTFTEATHNLLDVPSDLANVFNRARITIHPLTIDAAATTVVLAALGTLQIEPGQTIDNIIEDYRDPTNQLNLIGATSTVTPLVATTDYTANSASDGSGADLTSTISIVTVPFAAAAKFTITNNGTQTAFITKRQLRGKGIYDYGPVTFESYIAKNYGDRPIDIDLPYQNDAAIARGFADYIAQQFSAQMNQADDLGFDPQRSDALMTQALTGELGDTVTDTETMTGLSSALLSVVGIEYIITEGPNLAVRYLTASASSGLSFILDDAVHGVLDSAQAPLLYA